MSSVGERLKKRKANSDNMIPQIFEYKGHGIVPEDVTHVRFHPNVVEVEENAFRGCDKLEEVVLNEGLKTIGNTHLVIVQH